MSRPTGFTATLAQVRAAYETHYGAKLPDDTTFQAAGEQLVRDLGLDRARALVETFRRDGTPREPAA